MTSAAWAFCGDRRLPITRSDAFLAPPRLEPLHDAVGAIEEALANPLAAPPLAALVRGLRKIAIVIPDSSRPCPNPLELEPLLATLTSAGVPADGVRIVIGCGLHAATDDGEKERLVGASRLRQTMVVDAQGFDSPTRDLGTTSQGAPIAITRDVADAELALTIGIVEPHLYAGFSGGVKGVAIGCGGHQTITWTHRPTFVSAPGVALGNLDANPFREALLEIAARTPLRWGVNLVVDEAGRAVALAAGDPTRIQAKLAAEHETEWLPAVAEAFDVVVLGVPTPKADSLYQASRAATYVGLAPRPALRDGGLLVLCADLINGAGTGPGEQNFFAQLAVATSPAALVARGLQETLGPGGQRAFVVARVLQHHRLAIVGARDSAFLTPLEHLGVTAFDSVDAAVAAHEDILRRRARVLTVADGITTAARLQDGAGLAP